MPATTGQLPAVVTILDLGSATLPLDSSVVFEAVQTSNGTMISVQVPLTAIMTTVQGSLPTGGGTGQILNKTNANNYSTQWSSITQFISASSGLTAIGATALTLSIAIPNMRFATAAPTVALLSTDIEVGIDPSSSSVTVTLPSVVAWAAANPFGLALTIVDITGGATSSRTITPSLNGTDTFFYGAVTPTITQPYGLLKLRPAGTSTVTGWSVMGLN